MNKNIDTLLIKAKNKFLLSNAVALRAKQITGGSLPYINNFDPSNPIITAVREIGAEKIKISVGSPEKKKKKAEELLVKEEKERPSALDRLAKVKKVKSKKEKK